MNKNLWFPYTQMKTMKDPIHIKSAKGVYLINNKGNKLIDSVSSWWSTIHGYSNEEINRALKDQIDNFSHVMMGGITHDSVIKLSEKLASILPSSLDHCFFSDSGSTAVEVALKMATQYFSNKGIKKNKFISLKESYHGDTWKAMEVGDDPDYHKAFKNDPNNNFYVTPDKIEELEAVLKANHREIVAFIVEPILQGAGGFKIHSREYLKEARKLCTKYDVLFIFDEVATGFGRTGKLFVADEDLIPDIIVLGKALTAGYLGHAVTVASTKIYEGFYSNNPEDAFMHGPTFMGNPLACTVSLKSIEIFERDNYLEKIKNIEKKLLKLKEIKNEKIRDIRVIGACACIEVKDSNSLKGFSEFCYENGIFARSFLNFAYIMPPYIIGHRELDHIISTYTRWFNE